MPKGNSVRKLAALASLLCVIVATGGSYVQTKPVRVDFGGENVKAFGWVGNAGDTLALPALAGFLQAKAWETVQEYCAR